MRYLRRQSLSRKLIADRSLSVDLNGEILMDRPYSLQVPKGTTVQRSPDTTSPTYVNGMIRYNTDTDEFEGYQDGAWRSFRFKEPGNIIIQNLGTGDAVETTFGILTPDPFTYTAQSGVTWDATQMALNLVVLVENVYQIGNVNYTIVQNPSSGPNAPYASGTYIVFSTPVPMGKPVYVLHNFDQ